MEGQLHHVAVVLCELRSKNNLLLVLFLVKRALTSTTTFKVLLYCDLLTLREKKLFTTVFCLICSYDGEEDTCSSYASPYRSLLSAASLAASVKVNSVVRPALNPALSAQLNISMLQVKFTNHLHAIGQGKPSEIHL